MGARFFRTLAAGAAVLVSTFALGQGSASGYGASAPGGMGGGFGGGSAGFSSDEISSSDPLLGRAEQDASQSIWNSRTAILTPGEKVEFKFAMKANEVLVASASGESFDAALNVTDSKAAVLTSNDDREEGDQSPLIIFRAPADGTYNLNVLSFRSVAGGRFTIQYRTFATSEGKYGRHIYPTAIHGANQIRRLVLRFSLEKNQILDLIQGIPGAQPRVTRRVRKIYGPTGIPEADFEVIPSQYNSLVMLAKSSGTYYVEYDGTGDSTEASVALVPVTTGATLFTHTLELQPQQARILEFPVKRGGLVWTNLRGSGFQSRMSAVEGEGNSSSGDGYTHQSNRSFSEWQTKYGDDNDAVRVFKADGVARLVIRSESNKEQSVIVTNKDTIPEWTEGAALQQKVEIGQIKLFRMSSRKSELMKVAVQATDFVPVLDIFSIWGQAANTLTNRETLRAADDLYFPNEGEWIVRVYCLGFGGSGTFSMQREVPMAKPYTLGSSLPFKLTGANFGLYEVNLEAGKRYELLAGETDRRLVLDLLDNDGQFLRPQTISFGTVRASYFVPTRTGRHRLWIRGEAGDAQIKLSLHKPPTIP